MPDEDVVSAPDRLHLGCPPFRSLLHFEVVYVKKCLLVSTRKPWPEYCFPSQPPIISTYSGLPADREIITLQWPTSPTLI